MTVRVHEFAKLHALSSKELIQILNNLGYAVSTHMSFLPEGAEKSILDHLNTLKTKATNNRKVVNAEKKKESSAVHTKPILQPKGSMHTTSPERTVRKNKHSFERKKPQKSGAESALKAQVVPDNVSPEQPDHLIITAMTVGEFAARTKQPISDVIITLLRQGVVATKNQQIPEPVVEKLAIKYGITALKPAKEVEASTALTTRVSGGDIRQPIVVVMGHVDHGKTTLLDTIRKSRVASREKGGITQHLGAYEAVTAHGKITFLDTPGHEAFTMIRSRGTRIADIAILVVAADDGVRPQTVEAMRVAQEAQIPLIVALNKVDKASPAQLESTKRELAQRGLVPEDWGGQSIMIPISAKTGAGVDMLLEMVSLQAQLLELHARKDIPGQGFVIESRVEKGLGSIGTVIMREGTIKVGDYFIAGDTEGKIAALIDAQGNRVMQAYPAMPVLVAGFNELPKAGNVFQVVSNLPIRRNKIAAEREAIVTEQPDSLRIIVKADTASSLEAILGSLEQLAPKLTRPLYLVQRGIGPLSESDIMRAIDTKALIYGLHVKWEPQAQALAQKYTVAVHLFDIIYRLLDDVAIRAQKQKVVEKSWKKVGEALVLKVFDMKKMGVIAGAQVKSGIFTRDGKVKIFRGKKQIGEGAITSLQRDRKVVKEVHTGFECAFLVAGFSEWETGDRVECYTETVAS